MNLKDNQNFLTKKKLSIPVLNKDEQRWDMFLNKLKNNLPFVLQNNKKVNINNSKEIIKNIIDINGKLDKEKITQYLKPQNRYVPIFKTDNGNYKMNQFHKTPDFGGGSGTSLGTVNARIYETIQSLFFSLRQYLGRDIKYSDLPLLYKENILDYSNLTEHEKIRLSIYNHINSTVEINKKDLKYFENKGWVYTYIKTANKLYDTLNENKNYTFYHAYYGKGISDALYKAFNRSIKNINIENNITISMSRWNPSDIWIVETDLIQHIISELDKVNDMTHLNVIVDSMFENNILVGISLKKIPFNKEIQLIISKTLHTEFIYDYSTTSSGEFDTLTVRIHSKSYSWLGDKRKETLDTRIYTGKGESNIFAEIKGSVSKYGKSSLTYINSILNRLDITPIPVHQNINLTNDELKIEIIKLYNTIPRLQKVNSVTLRFNIEDTRSKLISKYQSLLFVNKLEQFKNKPHKRGLFNWLKFLFNKKSSITNYIIKEIFYYAYSMGGELFNSSKFYRIKTQ